MKTNNQKQIWYCMSDYLRFLGHADDRSELTIISSPFTFMSTHQARFLMRHFNLVKHKSEKSMIRAHDVGIDSLER
jgi:hypothetical protein